ncbi:DJ-1/PfpI family protein [Actomonas aquatica]|uniref:DJ-1/PfpI family protein n=1 Tax=Actomonas aquatica TaxID=2866162 RepID=A0ABZ1C5K3_9BACT|nr:DJ-1/PfpI family protein [Opitutus sp. WL0086]WRQ87013.1 DJ-1/PfpI family protein [Opitutus sp. WL0086]
MRSIALLLFDDVEVLDFAGPFEVFSVTRELNQDALFKVHTVGVTAGTIRARNGLKVIPDHTLESVPPTDVLIIPGGAGTRQLLHQESTIEWIRHRARHHTEIILSVCTGALLLARANLLDGLTVTTHHSTLDLLTDLAPNATVDPAQRFHDNGKIITAAGISAGIDASLHLVARLHGEDTARRTAIYMEYPWPNSTS